MAWRPHTIVAFAVAAALPAAGVAVGTSVIADRVGHSVGSFLSGASGIEVVRSRALPDSAENPGLPGSAAGIAPEPAASARRGGASPRPGPPANSATESTLRPRPKRGLRVSAHTVLRLANSGARPSGAYAPASGERPAGLLLRNVSALGVGLEEGDVLTEAGGAPALSSGDVIGVVLAARGRGASEVSGVFWRDGEPWALVVEQPYVKGAARQDPRQARGPGATGRVSGADAYERRSGPRSDTMEYAMVR